MKKQSDTKKIIFQAAVDEIAEIGMGKARISSIAQRAGVAAGLIHYHFKTKEKLYEEVINQFFDISLLDELTIVPIDREKNPLEMTQLTLYAISKWVIMKKSHNLTRFFHRLLAEEKSRLKEIVTKHPFTVERFMLSVIQDGIDKGIFKIKYPSYYVFDVIHILLNLVSFHYLLENEEEEELFFPSPYPDTLIEYYNDTLIRKIIAPDNAGDIPPLPDNLKQVMDVYLAQCSKKIIFGSWTIIVHIIAKMYNEPIEEFGGQHES